MTGPPDRLPEPHEDQAYPVAWAAAAPPAEAQPDLLRWARLVRARRKTVLWAFGGVVGVALIGVLFAPRIYMARASVVVEERRGNMAIMQELPLLSDMFSLGGGSSVDTQVAVLSSRDLQAGVLAKCGLKGEDPRDHFEVEAMPNTDVIQVRARARSRALATKLARTLVDDYRALTASVASGLAEEAAQFAGQQMARVKEKLDARRRDLKEFQEKNRAVALEEQTQAFVGKYAEMKKDYLDAQAEAAATSRQIGETERQLSRTERTVIAAVNSAPSPMLDKWEATLADLEAGRASLLQEYQPGSEKVRSVEEQIARARAQIERLRQQKMQSVIREQSVTINPLHYQLLEQNALLRARRTAAGTREGVIAGALREADAELAALPAKEFALAQLVGDVHAFATVYQTLMQQHEQLRIGAQASQPSAHLLDKPESSPRPISPRRGLTLAFAAVIGLILGVLVALGQEHLDTTVKTTGEVEKCLGAPVLGHVPQVTAGADLSGSNLPAPVAEAYRMVRSNIERAGELARLRAVMLTSAGPEEGKSLTAVNLALSAARRGRSVILVDADMRKPAVHERLKLDNQRGLGDVLAGDAELRDCLQDAAEGLRVLTGGPPRPDAADLLSAPLLAETLRALREMADLVVVDTPPALALADALLVAPHVDGVVVVVGSHAATKQALARVRRIMDGARARVIGAVVNKVDFERDGLYDEQLHYLADYYYGRKGYGPRHS